MAVLPVGAAGISAFVPPVISGGAATGATAAAQPASSNAFAKALDSVQALQDSADGAATGLATGQLTDLHEYTTAAAKAQLGVSLTAALRNRAVEAYQEIMRMQV